MNATPCAAPADGAFTLSCTLTTSQAPPGAEHWPAVRLMMRIMAGLHATLLG